MKLDPGFSGISALRESASEVQPPFAAVDGVARERSPQHRGERQNVYLLADQEAVQIMQTLYDL